MPSRSIWVTVTADSTGRRVQVLGGARRRDGPVPASRVRRLDTPRHRRSRTAARDITAPHRMNPLLAACTDGSFDGQPPKRRPPGTAARTGAPHRDAAVLVLFSGTPGAPGHDRPGTPASCSPTARPRCAATRVRCRSRRRHRHSDSVPSRPPCVNRGRRPASIRTVSTSWRCCPSSTSPSPTTRSRRCSASGAIRWRSTWWTRGRPHA